MRVTEQDVLNEEMYEEEDDDLPTQYRRLTAHLQTNSMDFNRRFQAYLQSHAGTRMALAAQDPAFAAAYMQYPAMPVPNPNVMQMVPTHLINPQVYPVAPQSYRHAPYPVPLPSHQRSASISDPQDMAGYQPSHFQQANPGFRQMDQRRMSLPAQAMSTPMDLQSPSIQPPLSRASSSSHMVKQESPVHSPMGPPDTLSSPHCENLNMAQPEDQIQSDFFSAANAPPYADPISQQFNKSPLSFALPPESQMVLGPGLQHAGFPAAMLMAGSEMMPQPNFYSYNPNQTPKPKQPNEIPFSAAGMMMSHNLQVDTALDGFAMHAPQSATTATSSTMISPFTPMFNPDSTGFDQHVAEHSKSPDISRDSSAHDNSNADWDGLVDLEQQPMWE